MISTGRLPLCSLGRSLPKRSKLLPSNSWSWSSVSQQVGFAKSRSRAAQQPRQWTGSSDSSFSKPPYDFSRRLGLNFSVSTLLFFSSNLAGAAALCQSRNDDDNNDQDFFSKIKSKMEEGSLSKIFSLDDETVNSILTTVGSKAQSAIDSGIPGNLSYGFLMGYLSGLALKKVGKMASIGLGLSFVALQSLAYSGYIEVNHEKLEKELYEKVLDRNKDGKVDSEDLRSILEDVKKIVAHGLLEGESGENSKAIAGGGGFGLGFLGGLRSG
mmetsp:Transcript_12382/g.26996  ORF Transcript_12382/g.26996 Transcript_12382/m.26996 type:complete len:270 (+) Transcript_12382:115-924(+)